MNRPAPTRYTLVFEGDIRKLNCNPLATETVFGTAYAAGIGDAFQQSDRLREVLKEVAIAPGVPWRIAEMARVAATQSYT